MRRVALVGLLVAAAAGRAWAGDPVARAAFSRSRLLPTEQVRYTVTVSADKMARNAAVPEPDFSEFDVIDGPAVSTSQNVSIINGQVDQSTVRTYSWLLVPRKEGQLAVPSVRVDLGGGRSVEAGRALIEVASATVGLGTPPPPATSPTPPPPRGQPRARTEGNRPWEPARREPVLEVAAVVDDDDVWLGQELTLSHVLRYDVDVREYTLKAAPDFPGFANTQQELQTPQGRAVRDQRSGAVLYHEATLARWCLVPLAVGKTEIEPQGYILTIQQDPFGSIFPGFGRSPFDQQVAASTKRMQVTVRPLPAGAPASFGGAVGTFRLEGGLDTPHVQAGDGLTLELTVEGAGSFRGVGPPAVKVPEGLKLFDPETVEKAGLDASGRTQGKKTFRYPILVAEPGMHEIPAVEWSFFDADAARYVTRRVGPFTIQADPGEVAAAPLAPGALAQATSAVEARGEDIRHVDASLGSWAPDLGQAPTPRWAWLVLALGPALNAGLLGLDWLARLSRSDPATLRARGAARRARARLKEARRAATAGRAPDAAHAVARAVAGLIGDRLQMGAELSPGEAAAALVESGSAALAADVESLLQACDLARFGSGTDADQATLLVARGEKLVPRLASARLERTVAR